MSQENSYYQVQSVHAVKIPTYAEDVASMIQDLMRTTPSHLITNVQRIQTFNKKTVSHTSAHILQSPTNLKVLQKHFNQNFNVLKHDLSMQKDEVTALKAAALLTLQQENLKIENKAVVEQSIRELISAKTVKQTTERLSSAFAEIKNQHTGVFTNTLTSAIQLAGSNIGFTKVKSDIVSPGLTRIVATNPIGYNLISEIHTNKEKKVDIFSELVNITDGTCSSIMDNFCKQMELLGVIASQKERKPTGGIAQMPFAKNLQKQRSKNKREFINEQVISFDNKREAVQYINNK